MKEWEYIRLMNRNYLQVRINQETYEETFPYKMIMSETINGLLVCRLREWNGVDYLLYNISSMQNLSSLYAERKMDYQSFCRLVYSIESIIRNVREYLLGEENLLLYPEFIFQEIDTKEINLVYYPGMEEENESGMELLEFLLAVADHEDESLVEIVYQSYGFAKEGSGMDWIEHLGRKLRQREEEMVNANEGVFEQQSEELMVEPERKLWIEDQGSLIYRELERDENDSAKALEERFCGWDRKRKILLLAGYVSIVSGTLYYLYSNFVIEFGANIIIWVILLGVAIGLVVWVFVDKKENPWKESGKGTDLYNADYVSGPTYQEEYMYEKEMGREVDCGKTMFFETEEVENKLYGIGKKNRRMIQMDKFPFIIGKKEGSVDGVIDDASVSRLHVRFFRKEEILWMEDLNSTNGTYKNGIMLLPHEKVEVQPEDEIRFGKLQFIYR